MKDLKSQKQVINIILVIWLLIGCRVSIPALSPSDTPTDSTIKSSTPTPMLLPPVTITSTEISPTENIASSFPTLSPSDYDSLLYENTFDNNPGGMPILPDEELFLSSPLEFSDFIFETEFHSTVPGETNLLEIYVKIRWARSPCPEFSGNNSYIIAVSGIGRVVALRDDCGNKQTLSETYAGFLLNSINKLTIIAKGDEFRIFLNGRFVLSFSDSTFKSGMLVVGNSGPLILFLNSIRIYSVED
jgi:hypothetical protein